MSVGRVERQSESACGRWRDVVQIRGAFIRGARRGRGRHPSRTTRNRSCAKNGPADADPDYIAWYNTAGTYTLTVPPSGVPRYRACGGGGGGAGSRGLYPGESGRAATRQKAPGSDRHVRAEHHHHRRRSGRGQGWGQQRWRRWWHVERWRHQARPHGVLDRQGRQVRTFSRCRATAAMCRPTRSAASLFRPPPVAPRRAAQGASARTCVAGLGGGGGAGGGTGESRAATAAPAVSCRLLRAGATPNFDSTQISTGFPDATYQPASSATRSTPTSSAQGMTCFSIMVRARLSISSSATPTVEVRVNNDRSDRTTYDATGLNQDRTVVAYDVELDRWRRHHVWAKGNQRTSRPTQHRRHDHPTT